MSTVSRSLGIWLSSFVKCQGFFDFFKKLAYVFLNEFVRVLLYSEVESFVRCMYSHPSVSQDPHGYHSGWRLKFPV